MHSGTPLGLLCVWTCVAALPHACGARAGALTIGLKNPDTFASISAFSPICNPINSPWGVKGVFLPLNQRGCPLAATGDGLGVLGCSSVWHAPHDDRMQPCGTQSRVITC